MRQRLEQKLGQWFLAPSSGAHLDVADGLRGLAILMVVVFHGFYYNPEGPKWEIGIARLIGTGWIGVPIFFVLSGFLISLPFFRGRAQDESFWYPPGYFTRRLVKIMPPFYLVIKAGAGWAIGVPHFKFSLKSFEFDLSFWSLWVEVGFYVVLPLLFFALRGSSVKVAGWTLFWILLAVPFGSRLLFRSIQTNATEIFFLTNRFPNSLDGFAWGVLFGAYYISKPKDSDWRSYGRLGYLGLLLLIGSILVFAAWAQWWPESYLLSSGFIETRHLLPTVAAFFLLFLIFHNQCWLARFFSSPALKFLGIVSYEWFLIHQPLQREFREWMSSAHGSPLRFLMIIAMPTLAALGLAILIYYNFSLPLLRWGRNRVKVNRKVCCTNQSKQGLV